MDHDHNHIHTREQLKVYDPALAELCKEVLGEPQWRFVSPHRRAGTGHLKEFDPAKSPNTVDPPHIEAAALDYYDNYWKDYWQRLVEKHALSRQLKNDDTESLAQAARKQGSAVRGAVLFPQQHLGCANCHTPGQQDRLGPDLTNMGTEANDRYLVEALLQPSSAIRKGFESVTVFSVEGKSYTGRVVEDTPDQVVLRESTGDRPLVMLSKKDIEEIEINNISAMPDGLVDQLADRQQFLDLVRYMIELKEAGPSRQASDTTTSTTDGGLSEEFLGLVLLDDFNCHACHRDAATHHVVPPKQAPDLAWGAGRIDPKYIERFIADPLRVKPGTTMPNVMGALDDDARRAAARAITHYLVSLGDATFQRQPLDPAAAKRGGELFHTVGCVACHSPRDDEDELPKESVPLAALEQKYNLKGLSDFLENPHAARPSGRMPNMQLSHFEAVDMAHYLLSKPIQHADPVAPFKLDRTLAEKGKMQFQRLGCGQCHGNDELKSDRDYPSLAAAGSNRGCLSSEAGNWPDFGLQDSQRLAMRAAIQRESNELTDRQQINLTLATFNCIACHQRGDWGGVAPERNAYFQTADPNLGPQGRIPPRLTGVGAKLKPKWLRQVLVSGRTIRPYIKTRMPQYGTDNVAHLVDLLPRVDQLPEVTFAEFSDQKEIRNAGHQMAGTDGLNCVACHTFQRKPALTMPAVDLTEMAERLQKKWFYHYLRDPQRLSTNTVMPSFWPSGRAIRKDILDGDTNLQIEALWQYLIDGRHARTPKGLIRERIELLATDEAVMLRRSYPGIGKRGIGVGYPGQVNLAFDAEQMRLAMIWQGKFADPGGVWGGQGSGSVRPLGDDLVRFAPGPEMDDASAPWSVDDGRPPQHRFKGYDLDSLQRPTFRYRFDNVDVADYPIDVKDPNSGDVWIRRTLIFTSEQGRENTVFRVATDQDIVAEDNGTYLIGKTLRIRVDDQHKCQIVATPAGRQLRIPLKIGPGQLQLVLEYQWPAD